MSLTNPIPLKVNQSNNKTGEYNVEVQQQFLDNNKSFKSYPLNKQIKIKAVLDFNLTAQKKKTTSMCCWDFTN